MLIAGDPIAVELSRPSVSVEDMTRRVFREFLPAAGLTVREPQIAMAVQIAQRLDAGSGPHLAIEAPTGSGKGLAYLVPTVLAAMRARINGRKLTRVLVSTSGIPLQRQLVQKDVPLLARAIGLPISAAIVKGRSNYVCKLHMYEEQQLIGPDRPTVQRIVNWVEGGGSGDREELPFDVGPIWGKVSVSSDECIAKKCPHFRDCLSESARTAARAALVVVMNHAYVTLGGSKWAEHSIALVADEGHDLEDAARRASASEIRQTAPRYWAKVVDTALGDKAAAQEVHDGLQALIGEAIAASGKDPTTRLHPGWSTSPGPAALGPRLHAIAQQVTQTVPAITQGDEVEGARQERRADRLSVLAYRVEKLLLVPSYLCVWTQRSDKTFAVCQAPIKAHAPAGFHPVIVTSATLGGGDPAEATKALGLDAKGLVLPPAWPVEDMSVVWVPQMPAPNDPHWATESARATVAFVRQCQGGVLVLATSWARMRELAGVLRAEVPWPVYLQGEAGRSELIASFAADRDSILVGTRSMFQGVDVPGDALRGVCIDRIPFPSPGDPMEQAIAESIVRDGGDAFRERALRVAGQLLRQAVGRLLRTETDRGAIAITDPRVVESRMSGAMMRALSPYPLTRDIADVGRVMRGEAPVHAVPTTMTLPLRAVRAAKRLPVE